MKRILLSFFTGLLALALLVPICLSAGAEPAKKSTNRFNVCFVLDSTNSLKETDPEKLRYDATKMFMGLLANEGNNVGSVIFSEEVFKINDIKPNIGIADKKQAESDLETDERLGATVFGEALNIAVDKLIEQGDPSLSSVVILLSDGQDDADGTALYDAKVKAKENNIPIYTVALNADGQADTAALLGIAEFTHGHYREVTHADDLKDVFKDFYKLIYSSGIISIDDTIVPDDGKLSVDFIVPSRGVEEINIIISSDNKLRNLSLTQPDGDVLSSGDIDALTIDAKKFTITKISNPHGGKWMLSGEGEPGATVKIDMVYNDTLSLETEYEEKSVFGINDKVTINGYILDDGQRMTGGYEEYTAKLIPDTDNGQEVPMRLEDNKYVCELAFDTEGTYAYHMQVEGNGIEKMTEAFGIKLNVGNLPPEITEKGVQMGKKAKHFWVFPFFTKSLEVDLSEAAIDPDGDPLTYTVDSSTYKDTSYEIQGDKLVIKNFYDHRRGSFTIRVSDPKNAFAEFDVKIVLTNVGILTIIAILLGIAAFVTVIIILGRKKFMGTITVANIETGESVTQQRNKGHVNLSSFPVGVTGLSPKCSFQATGKAFIQFKSPKPVIISTEVGKKKNCVIRAEDDVYIYSDDTREHGIIVTFNSFLSMM